VNFFQGQFLAHPTNTGFDNVFIWRCLFKNYIGWHIGDEKRFVY